MLVRPFRSDRDLAAVVALFGDSIHGLAATHYDETQRAAWAPASPDPVEWDVRLRQQSTRVALIEGAVAGFISFSDDGHIDLLYTSPAHARRGVASALYRVAEKTMREAGATHLSTDASLVATPFFARQGFGIVEEQTVQRRGIAFRRNRMEKRLDLGDR